MHAILDEHSDSVECVSMYKQNFMRSYKQISQMSSYNMQRTLTRATRTVVVRSKFTLSCLRLDDSCGRHNIAGGIIPIGNTTRKD
jgi:hypothetical protein